MDTFWQDVRYGIRMLLKNPGFTAVAVITLALGIGANTAIFSVVNAVLLRPLPYPDPDRLVIVKETNLARGMTDFGVSMPDFRDWRSRNQVFERMAAYSVTHYNISGETEPERVAGATVSAEFFSVLGVMPVEGRTFVSEEEQFGKHHVVIVSHGLWQRRFGADAQLGGQTMTIDGEKYTVVGVMPRGFQFSNPTVTLWTPLSLPPNSEYDTRGNYWLSVVARLKPGVTEAQAKADMSNIARQIEQETKVLAGMGTDVISLHEATVANVEKALLVLLGAVGFVLLIACTNVANLMLARAAARQREIAIRMALGASRLRLIRQLLTESLGLSLLSGAVGLLLAVWGVDVLIGLGPDLPRLDLIRVDGRVMGFTLALSLLTSVLFGLVPALETSKPDLTESLKEGGRGLTGRTPSRVRNLLVVSEVALSLVLLVSAGLMINSLVRLQQVNPGFRPENVLTMQISLPEAKYPDDRPEQISGFFQQLIERVKGLPGVRSAAVISGLPLSGGEWGKAITIADRPAPKSLDDLPIIQYRQVSADYFQTLSIPLVKGRSFTEQDRRDSLPVAIINETLARLLFPNEDPIGKRISTGPPEELIPAEIMRALPPGFRFPRLTIVGVISDVRNYGLNQRIWPEVYALHGQAKPPEVSRSMYLAVHTTTDPQGLVAAVRNQVLAIDKEQPVANVTTMEKLLAGSLSQTRFSTLLLGIFAALALVLAAVGLYGVMSYSVTQRTHEIGIRLALGAKSSDVLRLVVKQGMILALIGLVIGLAASFAVTRLMASLLYEVSAADPVTFAGIALLLAGVALLACYIPARRATNVDPMVALRYE